MSLRPGAVDFHEKWRDLKQTIDAVVHLRAVKRVRWNDNISYPTILTKDTPSVCDQSCSEPCD